ncbi:MAG: Lrp/AsnC family transcriptional regulator [Candidatus Altiarchaeota archaeon]
MAEKIDPLDLEIIKELQGNARQSYREIAEKLKVAEGTIYNRVSKLQRLEVIKRFITDIDYTLLGYELTAIIGLVAEGGKLVEIEEKIAREPNVTAVYDVTGDYDAMIVAKFKTREDLNKLVKKIIALKAVQRTNTMLVLNTRKEDHGVKLK